MMELLLIVLAVIVVGGWWVWREGKHEESGKHPLDGATKSPEAWPFPVSRPPENENKPTIESTPVVENKPTIESTPVVEKITSVLDVNKDGKVNLKDVEAAVEVTKKAGRKAKAKVEETVAKVKKSKTKKS